MFAEIKWEPNTKMCSSESKTETELCVECQTKIRRLLDCRNKCPRIQTT